MMVTWVGPNVSVMKKAKMSTDKALMKDIIQVGDAFKTVEFEKKSFFQNLSVEMQCVNANAISMDRFKTEVDKAGGAKYDQHISGEYEITI